MSEHFGFPLETLLIYVAVLTLSIVIDLHAYHKQTILTLRGAAAWSVFWVIMALAFYTYLWLRFDKKYADLFLVGFVLEESLSFDNLMVFMVIFSSFNISGLLLRRILFFGILGAIGFRILFASIGTALFAWSPWVGFVFAAIVAWTAWKMITAGEGDTELEDYSHHWSVRLTERFFPVFPRLHGTHLFIDGVEAARQAGQDNTIRYQGGLKKYATPAFLCLMAIQFTDVMFSFDSVPAVVAVTQEPLLVWGAMMFAVLGLRSLYYILEALVKHLVYLGQAVIALLFYIALKLAIGASNEIFHWPGIHIPPAVSLGIVAGILGTGILASFLFPPKKS
ncbi:MAG: TerC/Alx family metal homeostasis membrane protein [Magnetococcales bacterium]|nr:TerC/Alx family metal homeostasis membrane protein [Magnetococcales bacterium]